MIGRNRFVEANSLAEYIQSTNIGDNVNKKEQIYDLNSYNTPENNSISSPRDTNLVPKNSLLPSVFLKTKVPALIMVLILATVLFANSSFAKEGYQKVSEKMSEVALTIYHTTNELSRGISTGVKSIGDDSGKSLERNLGSVASNVHQTSNKTSEEIKTTDGFFSNIKSSVNDSKNFIEKSFEKITLAVQKTSSGILSGVSKSVDSTKNFSKNFFEKLTSTSTTHNTSNKVSQKNPQFEKDIKTENDKNVFKNISDGFSSILEKGISKFGKVQGEYFSKIKSVGNKITESIFSTGDAVKNFGISSSKKISNEINNFVLTTKNYFDGIGKSFLKFE